MAFMLGVAAVGCTSSSTVSSTTTVFNKYPDVETLTAGELAKFGDRGTVVHDGAVGEEHSLGVAQSILVSAMTVGAGDERGSWLDVELRIENESPDNLISPAIGIVCAGSTTVGGWKVGSSYRPGSTLGPGAYQSGEIRLVLPGDDRLGSGVPPCRTPAVVRITGAPENSAGPLPVVEVPIPDNLTAQLNPRQESAGSSDERVSD